MTTPIQPSTNTFRVTVGHTSISVQCADREQAIQKARELLSHDMPRLYDVIYRLDDQRFRVDPGH